MMRAPALLALSVVLTTSGAEAKGLGAVSVEGAWSRPATAGLPGVAYLTLVDRSAGADRLTGASSPKAATVTLHRSSMSKGVMTMTAVPDGLALPSGAPVKLAPGGYHLMLTGVKGGLKLGERYPLTLHFAHARSQTVQVEVRSGADAMAGMKMP